jgi:hypothetical protein
MAGDVTLPGLDEKEVRLRTVAVALVVSFIACFAIAAELGRAEGALTLDKSKVDLGYAYAVGRQHNEVTKRKDDVKIILTDKPLPADANLNEIDATLPENMYAVIFNVASNSKITHVAVLHPKGSYDAGFLEEMPDFRFKSSNPGRGMVAGHISSARVQTNTMQFSLDADFASQVK